MTQLMLAHTNTVYAVEPHDEHRAQIALRCPSAKVIDATIASFSPPQPVDLGLISHVFYHVPDHKWGAYTMRAARHLAPGGALLISLRGPDLGASRMLSDLGGPPFDLHGALANVIRTEAEFDFTWSQGRNEVTTHSLEDTLKIARFILCDRDEDAFARPLTEARFQQYVRDNFWDGEAQIGGWPVSTVYCIVERRR